MTYTLLNQSQLPRAELTNTATFEGYLYGDIHLSFFLVELPPGGSVRLHSHPCEEIFIIQDGSASFIVGSTVLDAVAGQVVIVPPGIPHKFTNSGITPLRQLDILPNARIVTEWLED